MNYGNNINNQVEFGGSNNMGNIVNTNDINSYVNSNYTEQITEEQEYINENFEKIILPTIWCVLTIYMVVINVLFIYYRNRPQFQYRGVKLNMLYCISATLYVSLIIAARIYDFSCILKLWITDICIVLSIFSVMSKAVRIIYLWKLNCYKLTNTKKKPITLRDNPYEPEANTYFKAVYKLINEEISKRMIILPVTLDFLITAIIHYLVKDKCDNNPLVFAPIMIFVVLFTVSFPYLIFQLHKVHEFHRIKTETEFLINTIIWWIVFPLYVLCEYFPKFKNNPAIQYYTNKGIFFFVIQELFVFFIITSIPFYEMYTDKKKYKDFEEEMMSIEYFYKLINDPIIIEELKEVAISEFSIENVLFWESYRELMKLSKHQKNSAIKKILYTGLNKINKELNHKSSKSNNIINKMINNDPHQNLNQDSSNIVYENEKYVGHKYYDNLSHQNQKKKNNVREMEMYPNNYYYYNNNNEYDYYNNCSSSNSTTNNLLEYTSDSTNSYYYSYSPTSPLNKNYTYIDKYQDNYDNYNFNLYQNQNQRRRSIKQYNINIESKTDNTENFNDNSSSSSSELSADTPVPLKLYNYYQNFYHTFIDVNSTAAVNINCSVRNTIEENIKNPKIGIFDEAKEEVILLMFRNLNPKLILQLKEKQMI